MLVLALVNDIIGFFCVYLYPHEHLKPLILFPCWRIGSHLFALQDEFCLWICHNVFASFIEIGTLVFAEVIYHERQATNDIHAPTAKVSVGVNIFFHLYFSCTHIQ